MPVVEPEKTEAKLMPASEEHVQKIVRLVLGYLEDFWSCKKIPGELFRRYVAKISGRYENAVWELLFPAHVVKLHTTDFFILRDDKRRPKGYDGLVDYNGVLPSDEPAPFEMWQSIHREVADASTKPEFHCHAPKACRSLVTL
jgi:hypothetical protein